MISVAIIGSKDLGRQIAHLVMSDSNTYKIAGFYDDFEPSGNMINNLPVLGKVEDIEHHYNEKVFDQLLIGIGYNHIAFRKSLFERFFEKVPFATFIHSSSIIDPSAKIKAGSIIYPGCIIDQFAVVMENVLVNLGCCISHESTVGAHSYLSPRVAVAGKVVLGERCFFGINATVIDNVVIGDDIKLGAATNVVKNIESKGLYVGNPAKKIKD